jgi:hypothetical protein
MNISTICFIDSTILDRQVTYYKLETFKIIVLLWFIKLCVKIAFVIYVYNHYTIVED